MFQALHYSQLLFYPPVDDSFLNECHLRDLFDCKQLAIMSPSELVDRRESPSANVTRDLVIGATVPLHAVLIGLCASNEVLIRVGGAFSIQQTMIKGESGYLQTVSAVISRQDNYPFLPEVSLPVALWFCG